MTTKYPTTAWNYTGTYSTSSYSTYPETGRVYHLSPRTDQVLAILLPIFSIPGSFMNVIVLWNLFVRTSKLNRPTRQLHGHLVISNFILLIVCVPSISLILYNGRIDYNNRKGEKIIVYELDTVFCNISGFIFNVMMRMTIHISTALAVDRVLAVQFPIFHKFKVQTCGYNWLLIIIWVFNLGTMATPYIVGKKYMQNAFECVCNWSINYSLLARMEDMKHFQLLRALVLLTYFFIPFIFTNFLTIICCIWVIALLLKKNLAIIVRKRKEHQTNSINDGHLYERLSSRNSLERIKENGHFEGQLKINGHSSPTETQDTKSRPSRTSTILKVTRSLPSPVSMLKNKKVKLSDAKVKRACYTMLIVMALQMFCYSVVQMMVVDQLLFYVFKDNVFSKHTLHNPLVAQIFINYPLYLLIFSILIPAVIHFRMTRSSRKDSGRGFTTNHTSGSISPGVSLGCSKKKSRSKDPLARTGSRTAAV